MHHWCGVFDVDVCCAAVCNCEVAAFSVVAKVQECALEFAIIGVASDAHLDGELADTDEVLGRSEWKPCRILLRSELVGGP